MPTGPKGEKRPADVNARAVMIAKIATGETEESEEKVTVRAKAGRKGGRKRAMSLTPQQKHEIASAAAAARWKKN
jgi:hypothetical protein